MIEWLAPGVVLAILMALGGWIWNLSGRLSKQDGRIDAASVMAANASAKATLVEQGLAAHKEHVAAEYVSRDAMKEVTDAINRLGDRLDNLFLHFLPKPPS